ncbi:uncharacterized protein LOC111705641 [Eurytemora carolleeae]|uniref:uncharacterized protein LOC111705641 n=1 Tax=Eurytemora carolleeae TaxID=1294199 RepID=UPI000C75F429|nr:uncharacterized protein LOC111705641 [Eurytemora carolleeae]|eukprot:XP_023334026.1 uncharacterized protein LOC111705641 [Eurytemora affinis]
MNRGAESVELHQAIEMYTINAAYTMRQEKVVGTLEPGKDADMIVISQDIFANKNTVEKTQVLQTLLAGNEVYRRSTYKPTVQNV